MGTLGAADFLRFSLADRQRTRLEIRPEVWYWNKDEEDGDRKYYFDIFASGLSYNISNSDDFYGLLGGTNAERTCAIFSVVGGHFANPLWF